jgi:hypothetical protein
VFSERGFALAAAMMVLALLCVLGTSAVQSTTLEVQISSRDRDARAALYLAEAALDEARYYVARGWGKIEPAGPGRVRVTTPTPGPSDFWEGGRYAGFTLMDCSGASFLIQAHTGGFLLEINVGGGDPAPGRFLVFREIPPVGAGETQVVGWDSFSSELRVEDALWATGSAPSAWNGWVLWNASRQGFPVLESGTYPAPATVWLTLPEDPAPGPFRLARNPWAAALAAAQGVPGDQDPATPAWDRSFEDGEGNPAGTARVTAQSVPGEPGRFTLSSIGSGERSRRRVSLTLSRAGLPEQRLGDWKVEDEL